MLKVKTKNFVDVHDWDNLVIETYGKTYSFQQQDGCKDRGIAKLTVPNNYAYDYKNDSVPDIINGQEMGVSFAAWLARDPDEWNGKAGDERHVDLFWERNFYPDVGMIANDLHAKGLLPAGEYVINIDW